MLLTAQSVLFSAAIILACSQGIRSDASAGSQYRAPAVRRDARASGTQQVHDAPHWVDFVPKDALDSTHKSLAEELLEAHEHARRSEDVAEVKSKQAAKSKSSRQPTQRDAKDSATSTGSDTTVSKVAKKSGKAIKQAARTARRSVKSYVKGEDADDEDEDDDEDDEEDDDDEDDYMTRSRQGRRSTVTRSKRRRARSAAKASGSKLYSALAYTGSLMSRSFWTSVAISRWTGRNGVWTPLTYVGAVMQWSAHTSWRTTAWTGQYALVGPVRTVTAPLVYLVDGLLFIFVWLPARGLRTVIREMYPVYVFLGAGLAIGTGMGIIAAFVIFVGSFIFGDDSKIEESFARRGEDLPREWERNLLQKQRNERKQRSNSASQSSFSTSSARDRRSSKGVVEQALEDSMRRDQQARRQSGTRRSSAIAPESDEEDDQVVRRRQYDGPDDYFFGFTNASQSTAARKAASGKGKGKAKQGARRSGGGAAAAPSNAPGLSPLGYPLPAGVTAQGGWSSRPETSSTVPATSPSFTRANLTGGSNSSSTTPVNQSAPLPMLTPMPSGGYERPTPLRQRRGVAT